ncbi:D-alanyl-D-alanine carboxypeptidase family protein [Thiomicrospira cyclica]|uniref:serine-type D-Ala-D-Ala carboxypeptidase n=1 Tax=Thiomicrospira cyclica (strain DSM 14477 / JCM 11371 / ALM1) TaxID=717773 RepID=F6D996_THICA|nr:D-alanyl-D-alanine carboxypeptidase family protein [Thiomicrospira cyclica]AEG32023.1 Beta-lactamase [Thiomicrospira cyclica ALM1]
MKLSRTLLISLLVSLSLLAPKILANTPFIIPSPPNVAGTAHIVMDFDSGAIITSNEPDMQIEPASLTKIMTGYVVFSEIRNGRIQLDDMVTISHKAWRMPGSRMFIEVDKQVSVEDLIRGMVIQSGNDASVALAEYIARTEEDFAMLMNQYAAKLGMNNTNFLNATGLPDPEHLTTTRDLAILARALINEFPEFYTWYSERSFTFNGINQFNRNRLLWQDATVDGLKTGHTSSAGYCLVSSAKRDDMRIISVIAGTDSANQRIAESQRLINYAFRFFETHKLYGTDQRLQETRVFGGAKDLINIGVKDAVHVTIPRGQYQNLAIELVIPNKLNAPIAAGDSIGSLQISFNNEILAEPAIVALESVDKGSFFKRLLDSIKLFFKNLFSFGG